METPETIQTIPMLEHFAYPTFAECVAEDRRRLDLVSKCIEEAEIEEIDCSDYNELEQLLKQLLDGRLEKNHFPNAASAVDCCHFQQIVHPQLVTLYKQSRPLDPSLFVCEDPNWVVSADELQDFKLGQCSNDFRRAMDDAGSKKASGYLVGFIHGQYDQRDDVFRLRIAGMVAGEKCSVLQLWRDHSSGRERADEYRALTVFKSPLRNPDDMLLNLMKLDWTTRCDIPEALEIIGCVDAARRIPEPMHSDYLCWLSQYQPDDLLLWTGLTGSWRRAPLHLPPFALEEIYGTKKVTRDDTTG